MQVIFDATRKQVKPATRRVFAAGLVINPRREGYTASDLAWAAANLNGTTRQYDVLGMSDAAIEQRAGCAMATARLESGWSGF